MSNSNRESSVGDNYNHIFSNDEGYANSNAENVNYGQHYEYVPLEDPMEEQIGAVMLNRQHITLEGLKQLRKQFKRDASRSNAATSLWVAQVPHRPGYEIRVYVPAGRKFEEELLRMGGRIPRELVKPGYVEYVSEEPGEYPIAVYRGVKPPRGFHLEQRGPMPRLPEYVSLTGQEGPSRVNRNLERKVREQIKFFEQGRGNSLLTEEPRYKRPAIRRRVKERELSDDEREEEKRIEEERPVYTNFQTKEAENRYIASLSKKIVNEAIHGRRRSYSTKSRAPSRSRSVRSSSYDPFTRIPTRLKNLYIHKETLIPGYNEEQTKIIRNLFEEEAQLKREEPKAYPGLKRYKGVMIKARMSRKRVKKGPEEKEAGRLIRRQYRHEKEPEPRYEPKPRYEELKKKTEQIIKFIGGNPKSYKSLLQNPRRLIELLGSKEISHEEIMNSWRILREFLKMDLEKRRVSNRPLYEEYLKIGRELRPKKGKAELPKENKKPKPRGAHKRIELKVKRARRKIMPLYPFGGIPISLIKEAEDENRVEEPKRNKSKMKRIHTNKGYISIGTKKCESYSKDELVKLCKEYGLPHSGTKPVLCQRLKDFHNS
jgi:hypothetical protein